MNILEKFEATQKAKLLENKQIDAFKVGDTVDVSSKIIEGTNERIQVYQGVVIAKRNRGVNSSFLVRKISHGEGVERRFMLCSNLLHSVKVVKRGIVRRAKLYYLRDLSGKAARIREDIRAS